MEIKAASPRNSLKKVLEKKFKYVIEDEDGTMEVEQIGADRTKNVLILMSDTGGGPRASAEAIRDAFQLEYGDEYRVFVKDLLNECIGWPMKNMVGQYQLMAKHFQLLAFHIFSLRWIHSLYLAAIAALYAKEVEAGLMEYKPDIIISVHPLMQHIPLRVLKCHKHNKVIFVTVITDLDTCHRTWFHPSVNRLYCPSEGVAKRSLFDGVEESQIRIFGLPVRPSVCRAAGLSKDDLRVELEMDSELPAVLLMGGGDGMGPVKKTAKALAETLFDKELGKPIGQLIVICGHNKALAAELQLQSLDWKFPVKIRGFEDQIEKWMGACDCIITKAGPGTIAEALIRGLPIILNDYIPGQEKGNVPYVVDNGAGVFTRSSKGAARLVLKWFTSNTDELKRISENALKLAKPNAVFHIVKDIHELAGA